MPRRPTLRFASWTVVTLLFTACITPNNAVRLAPEVRADSLVFQLSERGNPTRPPSLVYGLSVLRCEDSKSVWTITADGSAVMPPRVVYGEAPRGFVTERGPAKLEAGCYEVAISSARAVRFDVGADGTVRARR